jgi:hypothetical protein
VRVPVIFATPTDQTMADLDAYPTADGYYRLRVPVGRARPTAAIQLGKLCEFVQIEEVSYTPVSEMKPGREFDHTHPIKAITDAMEAVSPGLYRTGANGLLMVSPPDVDEPVMLSIVFRPVVWRKDAVALKAVA